MKKISSFIPVHVINKNDLIKELSSYIYEVFPKDILDMIDVSTVKEPIYYPKPSGDRDHKPLEYKRW